MKSNIKQKIEFNEKLLKNAQDEVSKIEIMKSIKNLKDSESKNNKLVIYMLVLYICCRLPELVCYFYFISIEKDFSVNFGPLLVSIVKYLYIVSYSFNLLIYFKFNCDFRKAFNNLFKFKKENDN